MKPQDARVSDRSHTALELALMQSGPGVGDDGHIPRFAPAEQLVGDPHLGQEIVIMCGGVFELQAELQRLGRSRAEAWTETTIAWL